MTAKIKLNAASGGGSFSLQAPSSSANNRVISLPDIADGTLLTSESSLDSAKLSPALSSGKFASYAVICDQKSDTTDAGTFTSGAWRTRDLNTTLTDADNIVTISSNQFILGAGSYLIEWSCPANRCGRHQTRLYDVTASANVKYGTSGFTDTGTDGDHDNSTGAFRITISGTGSNVYEIQHQCSTSEGSLGLGASANFGGEIYTVVKIFKEN